MSSISQHNHYWEQFFITAADIDHIVNFLVECECPKTIKDLSYEIIRYRHQQTVNLLKDVLAQGRIYRPEETYQLGEKVIFPHVNNAVVAVLAVRAGHNPKYEPFSVMKVKMENGTEREFVMQLTHEHSLNTVSYMPLEDVAIEDLYEQYGPKVRDALRTVLEANVQFLSVADRWFLRDLIMEVSAGQFNIAEALLDMAGGGPVPTVEFLSEMELPAEISEALQIFSLEYALLRDNRFDEVGPAGQGIWYLRCMEPKEVLEMPVPLRYMPIPYNRGLLDEAMLALESKIDDEWTETEAVVSAEDIVTIVLGYPHWRSGTLPLASRVANLFPTARITDRIMFSFVDEHTKEVFPGWVVRSGRYVFGLAEWYAKNRVMVGSYIDLRPGDAPDQIKISLRRIRSRRREWLRTVTVADRKLNFEVTRVLVACKFDELAAVAIPEPAVVDALAEKLQRAALETLLENVFSGLAGLSLQRAVHSLTLYNVLNLVRRVVPAPILTVLATSPLYESLGDNYWAYRGDE